MHVVRMIVNNGSDVIVNIRDGIGKKMGVSKSNDHVRFVYA
jgi:hypothetical protein